VEFYDCCANLNKKDDSTLHKYGHSNRHLKNVKGKFQDMQPTYACPAFLVKHFLCTNVSCVSPVCLHSFICLHFLPFSCHNRTLEVARAYDIV
jgi:hypothetical protein